MVIEFTIVDLKAENSDATSKVRANSPEQAAKIADLVRSGTKENMRVRVSFRREGHSTSKAGFSVRLGKGLSQGVKDPRVEASFLPKTYFAVPSGFSL